MYCKLCGGSGPLQVSHILSKFVYKPLKADDGRIYVLSSDPKQKTYKIQDGVKEKLLCVGCEQKRSRWETYVSNKWHRGELDSDTDPYQITGLDYAAFKLFLLSTLYMAHLSDHGMFREVKLDTVRHFKLRWMLQNSDPGESDEFGCCMFALEEEELDTKQFIDKAVSTIIRKGENEAEAPGNIPPTRGDLVAHRFVFGGFLWTFLEPLGIQLSEDVKRFFISKDGTITVRKKKIRDLPFIMESIFEFHRLGKLNI